MEYTTVTNVRWANRNRSYFDCDVTFVDLGTVSYTPNPNDPEAHSREIYARCVAGEFGPIAEYVLQPDEYPQPEPIANQPQPTTTGSQTL
jgi:hypothetical protein